MGRSGAKVILFAGMFAGALTAAAGETWREWCAPFLERRLTPNPAATGAKGTKMDEKLAKSVATPAFDGDPELAKLNVLPLGSALATGSGELEKTGITQIIHAASGSMKYEGRKFDPSLASVTGSVSASLELARRNGHRRVALPFIGGKVFAERIGVSLDVLARAIVETALREKEGIELRFMTFGAEDTARFQRALAALGQAEGEAVAVINGSIVEFSQHGASAIVNAANTEVLFGGGLSGVIAEKTGRKLAIDEEAAERIREYHRATGAKP